MDHAGRASGPGRRGDKLPYLKAFGSWLELSGWENLGCYTALQPLMSELFIKQELMKVLPQLDAIVFDVDGVLLDISQSFRAVITDTVQYFAVHSLGLADTGPLLSAAEAELFKFAGGFNDDVDLTHAALYLILGKWAKGAGKDTASVRDAGPGWAEYTAQIKRAGGGLQRAEGCVLEMLNPTQRREFALHWHPKQATRLFQEMYGGHDACAELYGFQPEYIRDDGYYRREKVLIDPALLPAGLKFGLVTGRTVAETRLAMRTANLTSKIPESAWVTSEVAKKPDGAVLFHARERMSFKTALYIGDTMDDLATVSNYRDTKGAGKARIFGGITLTSPTGEMHRRTFLEAGADAVAPDINFLLQYLSAKKR